MVKGQQARSGSAASGKEKKSTQPKRNQQPCLFVTGDGRQYPSHEVAANYIPPSPSVVPTPPSSWHTYSDHSLPLSANQDQFVLTDADYLNHQDAISRVNQAISFQNPSSELSPNNYAHLQYDHLGSTAHHGVSIFDPAPQWGCGIPVVEDLALQNMLVTGAQGGVDPFLPLPGSHFDDVMTDFAMETGVDVLRHAGGVVGAEGMDVFDQLDLTALGEFPCLPSEMDLLDPVSLSPAMTPLHSSELAGNNFPTTLIPIQSSDVPAPSVPIVAPSAAVLPANVQAVFPPPIVPSAAHHQTGEIENCFQLLKLMKPLPNNTPTLTHSQANPGTPVDSRVRATPPSLPLLPPSAPGGNVVMTPSTPGHPVSVSASSLLQCATEMTATEHVFTITDSAAGMRKSPATFCAHLFRQLREVASIPCSQSVVCDRLAKLPDASVEGNKLVLKIPKDCVPLAEWTQQCQDMKERVLVVQEIVNTLSSIHTGGDDGPLSMWGSFSVWVGTRGRVYLVPDFTELLQKQQEVAYCESEVNPITFDQWAVSQLVSGLVSSLSHHQLLSATLACKLLDIARGKVSSMIQVARVLGEKRLCKLEVMGESTVEVYCLEHEKLSDALQPVKKFLPIGSLWEAYRVIDGQRVPSTDMSTPDRRRMDFFLVPLNDQVPSSKFVVIRAN